MAETDTAYLLRILADGHWHQRDDILRQSMQERGCGMTVHSRAADLRKLGYNVECDVMHTPAHRRASFYRIPANG